jgi:hypothetical protein
MFEYSNEPYDGRQMMNKTIPIAILITVAVLAAPVFADDTIENLDTFTSSFEDFSETFAGALPLNALIGLNWSDAYIGQLLAVPPHFGVGVTTGFTTIPTSAFDALLNDLGVSTGKGIGGIGAAGLVLPGYAIDARIGGIGAPFDVGAKVGILPGVTIGDLETEYTNVGFDVRYALLDGGVVMPKVSIGAGYSYLNGRIAMPLGPNEATITSVDDSTTGGNDNYRLVLEDPTVAYEWEANVFDLKAQISKSFVVVEPHFGLGASYAMVSADTGIDAGIVVQDSGGTTLAGVSPGDIAGEGSDVSSNGISVGTEETLFAYRVFGGASFNMVLLRVDLGLSYSINSGAWGATLGGRVQL